MFSSVNSKCLKGEEKDFVYKITVENFKMKINNCSPN